MRRQRELFQVLVVDDEEDLRITAVRHLGAHFDVQPLLASTQSEAEELIDEHYFDAAIVDVELDSPVGGIEVIRKLFAKSPTTSIVVATRYHDEARVEQLLALTGESQMVEALYKVDAPEGWQRLSLEDLIADWRRSRIGLDGTDEIVEVLQNGGRIPALRRNKDEVRRELDRLLCRLFGTLAPIDRQSEASVTFRSMRTTGLSSAAVFEAEPIVGSPAEGKPVSGIDCVVKVGAREEIAEEADRYDRFVRFGAHLNQRVELLSSAFEHSLGAICYSLVGARDATVHSFDAALRDPDQQALALETLEDLFRRDNRSWYSVAMTPQAVTPYFRETYSKTMVKDAYKHLDESLNTLSGRCRSIEKYRPATNSEDGWLLIGGVKLTVPRSNIFGGGAFTAGGPACLVHGDMHGGNVLIEMTPRNPNGEAVEAPAEEVLRRVCLIDYRYAGPGPRCVDFAALEVSARFADADAVMRECYADPGASPAEPELDSAVAMAAKRHEQELALGLTLWDRVLGSRAASPRQLGRDWQAVPSAIRMWAIENFHDLTLEEYTATLVTAGVRQMAYDLGEVARIRLLAWISAQHLLLTKSEETKPETTE